MLTWFKKKPVEFMEGDYWFLEMSFGMVLIAQVKHYDFGVLLDTGNMRYPPSVKQIKRMAGPIPFPKEPND